MKTDKELFESSVAKLQVLWRRMADNAVAVEALPNDLEASRKKWMAGAFTGGGELGLTTAEIIKEIIVGPFDAKG